ncbi:hypothetical protein POM88_026593 [Heracleum sosnowskyi]|uniref:F-box protein n=1 Tax=Heracleum sosnowskyi TaxID=360622 RepID=A0AAD8MPD3_9APIA|nr:hypothetical protein POM88_026593 [Heracleum sosnowskyi]
MIDGVRKFHQQDSELKKPFYSRDFTKKFLYYGNFDLYRGPAANWGDTIFCIMSQESPEYEEMPAVCSILKVVMATKNYTLNPYGLVLKAYELRQTSQKVPMSNALLLPSVIHDRRSGEFKLAVFGLQLHIGLCSWYVLNIGIENSWKKISGDHKYGTVCFPGLSFWGFLAYKVGITSNIVTLDVSDETFHMICCPKEDCSVTYLTMGNDLSCISQDSKRIYVHVLKEILPGKWRDTCSSFSRLD